jgi:hypothetical protein
MTFSEFWLSIHKISSILFALSVYKFVFQAVPYSREFKQKYDYFRKKLKKPVSNHLFQKCCALVICELPKLFHREQHVCFLYVYIKNVTFLFSLHFDPPGSSIWIFFLTETVSEDWLSITYQITWWVVSYIIHKKIEMTFWDKIIQDLSQAV